MIARGNPKTLLAESTDPKVQAFLTRGQPAARGAVRERTDPTMAKRANPTLIGAFVMGGLVLVVGALLRPRRARVVQAPRHLRDGLRRQRGRV